MLLFACAGPSQVKIDESANGTAVSLRAGQTLIVTLKSNPTTGYEWQVDHVDESVVQPTKQEFQPASDPNRLGAPGQTVHEFQAVGAGTTDLRLVYVRPWEKGVEPEDTFQVSITVK
jgi:inhibitor of cysteine peptidase